VHDSTPGITRHEACNGFDYRLPDGSLVRDIATLKRIRNLAIPPAWTDVWICRGPNGHLQATGRDQRGRKQYRYHPRWREVRDDAKYIFDGYIEGTLLEVLANKTAAYLNKNIGNMSAEEAAIAAFPRLRLAADLAART
jgi:DNA topoisomerase IB